MPVADDSVRICILSKKGLPVFMNLLTANRLQQFRKANGYTQEVLAEKLSVSRQSISKWERGEAIPEIDNLMALSKLYGVTIDALLDIENKT